MIDWQLLILLLRNHGKKTSMIAKDVSMDYHHLKRLATGTVNEPRFNSGVRLIDYAHEHLPTDEFMRVRR